MPSRRDLWDRSATTTAVEPRGRSLQPDGRATELPRVVRTAPTPENEPVSLPASGTTTPASKHPASSPKDRFYLLTALINALKFFLECQCVKCDDCESWLSDDWREDVGTKGEGSDTGQTDFDLEDDKSGRLRRLFASQHGIPRPNGRVAKVAKVAKALFEFASVLKFLASEAVAISRQAILKLLTETRLREPDIPPGHRRMRWKNVSAICTTFCIGFMLLLIDSP
ncbi:hypothetical protein JDV02_010601 [Purpureocillium takamizusanense]|uniref:Uncharacterized protein n=1 Tax=Purpureocillium takamizusanense TaxID=2060973 RepID=A0A9Q8QT09_9HYPO|nr:uncharacterized protein JDV02_010601 [Purpureocillium takamizusanense]UNI24882.1 hypothetical protein JDV02_010601 [Purpureocillium takamizusanense]